MRMRRAAPLLMLGVLLVTAAPAGAAVHEHWIAAVPVRWDVAPNGQDAIHHAEIEPGRRQLQTVAYRAYTRNWGRRLARVIDLPLPE